MRKPTPTNPTETRALFLADIEAFLLESEMTATRLGVDSMKNPKFVLNLRRGGDVQTRTMDKVRRFMAAYAHKHAKKKRRGPARRSSESASPIR